jgi:hypothetical membrane protein
MRWLAACGLVAPPLDVLVTVWLGALDPNYSHVRQALSELGEEGRPYAAVFNAWCVVWGLLFMGFAVALGRGLGEGRYARVAPGALLVAGAGSILAGFFPCDPGCVGETFSARVHYLVGEIATAATVVAPFLAWAAMRGNPAWRGDRSLTLASAGLIAFVTGWMAVCHYAGLGRSTCALGAAQRLFFGFLYVWVEAMAIRLWTLGTSAEPGGTP